MLFRKKLKSERIQGELFEFVKVTDTKEIYEGRNTVYVYHKGKKISEGDTKQEAIDDIFPLTFKDYKKNR